MLNRLLKRALTPLYHALYHQLAWLYDAAAWVVSFGRWNKCIAYLARQVPPSGRILELGHGPGHLQAFLSSSERLVSGLDASPQMSRKAFRLLRKSGLPGRLVNGCSQNLPFATGSFRCLVSTFPAPNIFDPRTLSEACRVLAADGELHILLTAWFLGDGILESFWKRLFRRALDPAYDYPQLQQIFAPYPWKVTISIPVFEDNRLLVITCLKFGF